MQATLIKALIALSLVGVGIVVGRLSVRDNYVFRTQGGGTLFRMSPQTGKAWVRRGTTWAPIQEREASGEASSGAVESQPPIPLDRGSFRIVELVLGKSLAEERRIANPTTAFGVNDSIYVVIESAGSGSAVDLRARWTYQDRTEVAQDSQLIAPTGPAWTEFHIMKPTRWPRGRYSVEVTVNGTDAVKREFAVN
jgi:hypothetical protein